MECGRNTSETLNPPDTRLLTGIVRFAIAMVLIWLAAPASSLAFELPDSDPWYYQSNVSWQYMVPDKAQHYYGSQLLVVVGMHPTTALATGFMYEVYQNETGAGFSYKDLIADAFGVLAGEINSEKFFLYMDYSTREENLKLKVVLMF